MGFEAKTIFTYTELRTRNYKDLVGAEGLFYPDIREPDLSRDHSVAASAENQKPHHKVVFGWGDLQMRSGKAFEPLFLHPMQVRQPIPGHLSVYLLISVTSRLCKASPLHGPIAIECCI